jgi:hypothetical protein
MPVRDTSAISHAINHHESLTDDVVAWVASHGPCSRKQIAVALGRETGCVSGITTPLVKDGKLDEVSKQPCPITGRVVLFYDAPVEQQQLFD